MLIVEAPKKVKTLTKVLGAEYRVLATGGHIMDLPAKDLGVDIAHDFLVKYDVLPGKQRSVDALRSVKGYKGSVFICTDADREGERIGAHVANLLGVDLTQICRVTYGNLGRQAVLAAIAVPRAFDKNLLDAQEARRVVDRLMGYLISKWLWKVGELRAERLVAAGRVQSAVLNLVVTREEQVIAFVPQTHYMLKLRPKLELLKNSTADMVQVTQEGEGKFAPLKYGDLISINMAVDEYRCSNAVDFEAVSTEEREVEVHPPPALITSSMLKAACTLFGWTPSAVMSAAQDLYAEGLVTYIRTDNPNMSEEFLPLLRAYYASLNAEHLMADTVKTYKAPPGAQEAHEAIRPTDLTPRWRDLPEPQNLLYRLIELRAVLSAARPAKIKRKVETFRRGTQFFQRRTGLVVDRGWLEMGDCLSLSEDFKKMISLPELPSPPGDLESLVPLQYPVTSQPPARFTTATLTDEMERLEIGRPSTYATVFLTLEKHKYISYGKRGVVAPTPQGCLVIRLLRQHFAKFIDPGYTRLVEADLDKIAAGTLSRETFLNLWYHDFVGTYDSVMTEVERQLQARPKPGFVA